jgi:hypothetical protein
MENKKKKIEKKNTINFKIKNAKISRLFRKEKYTQQIFFLFVLILFLENSI